MRKPQRGMQDSRKLMSCRSNSRSTVLPPCRTWCTCALSPLPTMSAICRRATIVMNSRERVQGAFVANLLVGGGVGVARLHVARACDHDQHLLPAFTNQRSSAASMAAAD